MQIKNGLNKISPDRRDLSIVHTFGATMFDVQGLPENFSIYDGRKIPNQNMLDDRFNPPLQALYLGCTAETGTFDAGIQDGELYNPDDMYANTSPGRYDTGRDMRKALKTLVTRGPRKGDGTFGPKRVAYFTCYGAG